MHYQLTPKAYGKVLAHCFKYPWKAVHGVLLASAIDASSSPIVDRCVVVDALPWSHNWLGLLPLAEVARQLTNVYCRQHQLRIVGYYIANERVGDVTFPSALEPVVRQLPGFSPAESANLLPLLLVIRNDRLTQLSDQDELPLLPQVWRNQQWNTLPGLQEQSGTLSSTVESFPLVVSLDSTTTVDVVHSLLKNNAKVIDQLADFDEHLEVPTSNWIDNSALNQLFA
ncbi:ER membrane protein complex subunit 8 [Dispira simplex]|nr:ER membrane protein complex subunit 8 [Dispira simplex]